MRPEETNLQIDYIEKLFVNEDAAMLEIRQKAKELGRLGIQIRPYEGQLLYILAKLIRAEKIVEIGTSLGYSTLWMARALPPNGKIFTFERDQKVAEIAKKNFSSLDQIELVSGEAKEELPKLEAPFDLVFIDANKSAYCDYLDWAEQNVRPGGLIIGDNTFLFGKAVVDTPPEGSSKKQWEVMREFNRRLADPEKYDSILFPTGEGLTVGIKKN